MSINIKLKKENLSTDTLVLSVYRDINLESQVATLYGRFLLCNVNTPLSEVFFSYSIGIQSFP